jgi:hypothetical protein
VFYARVPQGSGSLVFADPRGILPPFGNVVEHLPQEGELIVFPGWLGHQVQPSHFESPSHVRVSFSCNAAGGGWTDTSDLNVAYSL